MFFCYFLCAHVFKCGCGNMFVGVHVHVNMCVRANECGRVCAGACGGLKLTLSFLKLSPLYFLRQDLSLNLELSESDQSN